MWEPHYTTRKFCPQLIEIAHESHEGLVWTEQLLCHIWFPRIDYYIEDAIMPSYWGCALCQATTKPPWKSAIVISRLPKGPWESIAINFYGPIPAGHHILVTKDQYSQFPVCEFVTQQVLVTQFQNWKNYLRTMVTPKLLQVIMDYHLTTKSLKILLWPSLFFLKNWDSLHARLNSHYEAWSYKKKSTRKITGYRKSV